MIFTNPQAIRYEQRVQERGTLKVHFLERRLSRARVGVRFQLGLLARFARGRRLLDFGAGNGVAVDEGRKLGWDAHGVDLNRGLAAAANEYWGFDAIYGGSLSEYGATSPKPFDAIISNQVFEHLHHPLEVGRSAVSLLNSGGVLFIDVPYAKQPAELVSRGKTLDPTAHVNHFTVRTLQELMGRVGCGVVYCSAAPSLVQLYRRFGMRRLCYPLGRISKRLLPPIGTGVCVIGRKEE